MSKISKFVRIFYVAILFVFLLSCKDEPEIARRDYPRLSTQATSDIDTEGATFHGTIDYLNSPSEILDHGFVFNNSNSVDIRYDYKISLGKKETTGAFEARTKKGLIKNVVHYVAAFVQTKDHVVYGNLMEFTSRGSTGHTISKIVPSLGIVGDTVKIVGSDFVKKITEIQVWFDGQKSTVLSSTDSTIICAVPYESSSQPVVKVMITGNVAEIAQAFSLASPEVATVSPNIAAIGDTVEIVGNYFDHWASNLNVYIGGHKSQIISATKYKIKVKVPSGLTESQNKITVQHKGNGLESNIILTIAPPEIIDYSKYSGVRGEAVKVVGKNFSPNSTKVWVGNIEAGINSVTDSEIEFRIPDGPYDSRDLKITVVTRSQSIAGDKIFSVKGWIRKNNTLHSYENRVHLNIDDKNYMLQGKILYQFDATREEWVKKSTYPTDYHERLFATAANGKGYFGLGDSHWNFENSIYEYNPSSNTWNKITTFPGGERTGAMGFTVGDKIYVGLGRNNNLYYTDCFEYNIASGSWISKTFLENPVGQFVERSLSLHNKGYVFYSDYYNTIIYEYDPAIDKWTKERDVAGVEPNSIYSYNNKIYIIGNQKMISYDPLTNNLEELVDLPGAGGIGFYDNGKIYLYSGQEFWEYLLE